MGTFIGFIIGSGTGLLLSIILIFPDDPLSTPLSAMTLGYILRILGGLFIALLGGIIGGAIGGVIGENERVETDQSLAAIRERVEKEEVKRLASDPRMFEYRNDTKKRK